MRFESLNPELTDAELIALSAVVAGDVAAMNAFNQEAREAGFLTELDPGPNYAALCKELQRRGKL